MGKRVSWSNRCLKCAMRRDLCICDIIPRVTTQTLVTVIMHKRETYTTTNTGRLAHRALSNSNLFIRGEKDRPLIASEIFNENYQPLLLHLDEFAQELSHENIKYDKPIQLIVPDGSWRQASKMAKREEIFNNIPKVKLPFSGLSNYELRREPKDQGLATLEAIARALGIIESPYVQMKLEDIFLIMVNRTKWSRKPTSPIYRDI